MADKMNFASLKNKAIHYVCSNIKKVTHEKGDLLQKFDSRTLVIIILTQTSYQLFFNFIIQVEILTELANYTFDQV